MVSLQIDSSELKSFTETLKKMHRAAFPNAVRNTLNDAAFDMYRTELPKSYKEHFTVRNSTFLKSHSKVNKAEGWDISQMQSEVGIFKKAGSDKPIEGLANQETGGAQKDKSMYLSGSRGYSKPNATDKRKVKQEHYIKGKSWIEGGQGNKVKRSRKSNFVAAAYMAMKLNLLLLWETKKTMTLFKIESISTSLKTKKFKIKTTPIALINEKILKFNKRAFMYTAGMNEGEKINALYAKNVKKSIERYKYR